MWGSLELSLLLIFVAGGLLAIIPAVIMSVRFRSRLSEDKLEERRRSHWLFRDLVDLALLRAQEVWITRRGEEAREFLVDVPGAGFLDLMASYLLSFQDRESYAEYRSDLWHTEIIPAEESGDKWLARVRRVLCKARLLVFILKANQFFSLFRELHDLLDVARSLSGDSSTRGGEESGDS